MRHRRQNQRAGARDARSLRRATAASLAAMVLGLSVITCAALPPDSATAATAKTIPELMSHRVSGSTQMIVITGKKIGSTTGTLRLYNKQRGRWVEVLSAPANFGKRGLVDGAKRREGGLQTPTGIWRIGSFVFGTHASPSTRMPYRRISAYSWWSSARNSTYNTWVESRSRVAGERLKDSPVQYEYALDTGYNALPNKLVVGRGTAIFIHCFEPPGNSLGKYTHGCVAVSRAKMTRLLAILDPKRAPTCVIGTEAKGTPTSVWAY
jgi:L,D-peptidoglycan transpeptidase YkuD (ErfK/YbiS/YcfS/YnhG family)